VKRKIKIKDWKEVPEVIRKFEKENNVIVFGWKECKEKGYIKITDWVNLNAWVPFKSYGSKFREWYTLRDINVLMTIAERVFLNTSSQIKGLFYKGGRIKILARRYGGKYYQVVMDAKEFADGIENYVRKMMNTIREIFGGG